ncbi:maltose alpha-D-glucosyltransferase [Camelimonas abortus]|uniref:Maltokinase n=1 Tax=Camelimonas abortus TaxID=1017184 RepID=A0ABV7LI50_9HYPH
MINRDDIHWYREAIIYQVHVKSFFDSNNDGVGDFAGLTAQLDYIRDLGATAIWVMPFYPSPLKDDGYDIADYHNINPAYGDMDDFRRFIHEAHARGLRVITELVINHTSDQHPWFQRARHAPPGSPERDFYVWSDTDERYRDARIIFCDVEKSNWTWDPVAGAYYWHRFYSHQPDLNFENPAVLQAVLQIMEHWFELGVDGLRLDAISYLVEEEGTSCDNLPGTHEVIRKIRAFIDARYPDRMLLAEANLWPEGIAAYFGRGDECHMAFHFPLMPRMYMAVASEERHPITDIMRQTPELPDHCQWAIFLRNHDELTLEMVTEKERDYLWKTYAADARARLNLGIRRRLAPLLENDRRKIELLNSLLLSMPGTPVIYYGDEIGMGDNIYLGDRDGVRTPMQWSPDRNGGFSRADPARLVLPPVQDPVYGFEAVNVESQRRNPSSLLNWMRRMVAVRRNTRAFGLGSMRFIYPENRRILAYVRAFEDETILCVCNLSRAPQAAEMDLSEFAGWRLVEMTGGAVFPPVTELPYQITLPAYGFYWFRLQKVTAAEEAYSPRPVPELFTLILTGRPQELLDGREGEALTREALPRYLASRRWFPGRRRRIAATAVADAAPAPGAVDDWRYLLTLVDVTLRDGSKQQYFVPMAVNEEADSEALLPYAVARLRRGSRMGVLHGAEAAPEFIIDMVQGMRCGARVPTRAGGFVEFRSGGGLADAPALDPADMSRMGLEQSNTSMALGARMVLKLYRRLQHGVHPEEEMCRYLTEVAGFAHTPRYLGSVRHVAADGTVTMLALLQEYVRNQGDAWRVASDVMLREIEHLSMLPVADRPSADEAFASFGHYAAIIGQRVGEMHRALARPSPDPDFSPERLDGAGVDLIAREAHEEAARAFDGLRGLLASPDRSPALARLRELATRLVAREGECRELIDALAGAEPAGLAIRIHGDLNLRNFLINHGDVTIIDFEGVPGRPVDQRRRKTTPLRDVADLLRSMAYVTETVLSHVSQRIPHMDDALAASARRWGEMAMAAALESYDRAVAGSDVAIADGAARARLLRLCLLARSLLEISHELETRPDCLHIPVRGVLDLLDENEV